MGSDNFRRGKNEVTVGWKKTQYSRIKKKSCDQLLENYMNKIDYMYVF